MLCKLGYGFRFITIPNPYITFDNKVTIRIGWINYEVNQTRNIERCVPAIIASGARIVGMPYLQRQLCSNGPTFVIHFKAFEARIVKSIR